MWYWKMLGRIFFAKSAWNALGVWADIACIPMEYVRDNHPDDMDMREYSFLVSYCRLAEYVLRARELYSPKWWADQFKY